MVQNCSLNILKLKIMKRIFYLPMFILLFAGGMLFTQCTTSNGPTTTSYLVNLSNSATLGSYLTDKNGYALYFFSNDANGANNCTGGCTANWPIFNVTGLTQTQLGAGLALADFATITTPTGSQLTYKGWPLYTYAPAGVQEASGQTSGNGTGGIWFVAKPDYTIMLANYQLVGIDANNYVVSATDVTSLGTGKTVYFTDLQGRTLYAFAKDSAQINKYTKADFSNNGTWPIYTTSKVVIPSTLDKTLFDSITVYGQKQLTYKGWPIYYFGADQDTAGKFRGNTKGVSVPATLNIWKVFINAIPAAPHK
jgi:predicted lipoprotein with Yx(FWY)xxD motif